MQAAALGVGGSGTPLQRRLAQNLGVDEVAYSRGGGTLGVVALGKRITSEMTLRLEQSLGGTAGSIVKLDYLLSEHWRLRGTTGTENAGDIFFSIRFD